MMVSCKLNDKAIQLDVAEHVLLSDFLRNNMQLTNMHIACTNSMCGACAVHVDNVCVKSCTMLAIQADGCSINTADTIAALDKKNPLAIIQRAFFDYNAFQCELCRSPMIMSSADLLMHNKAPKEHEILSWLEGNICNCSGYYDVVKAIQAAGKEIQSMASLSN